MKKKVPQRNQKFSWNQALIQNLIKEINIWVVNLVNYSRPYLE